MIPMATVDKLRDGLIDKIRNIKNKDLLEVLDQFVSSSQKKNESEKEKENVSLTEVQKQMLEMSEQDIKNGNLISQNAMKRKNFKWLNEM
tara:strand:- start:29168 stop:29437 length:270 start_codon:yes stop_codon:yes gene_type:complete